MTKKKKPTVQRPITQLRAERARNKRWRTVQVRLTHEEFARLEIEAGKANQTTSPFARELLRAALC